MKKIYYLIAILFAFLFSSCEEEPLVPVTADLTPEIISGFTSTTIGATEAVTVRIVNNGSPTTGSSVVYLQKMIPVCNIVIPTQTGISVTEQGTRYKIEVLDPIIVANDIIVVLNPTLIGSAGLTATVVSGTAGGETPTDNSVKSFDFTVQ